MKNPAISYAQGAAKRRERFADARKVANVPMRVVNPGLPHWATVASFFVAGLLASFFVFGV